MKATHLYAAPENTEHLIALLSQLTVSCDEDAKRFERASREVSNEELALLFARYARRRSEFSKELTSYIERVEGREPAPVSGLRLHAKKGSEKQVGRRRDDGAILCNAEVAERALKELYEEVLKHELPGELQMSLRRQYLAVSDVYDQMHDLCEALAWCAVPMAV